MFVGFLYALFLKNVVCRKVWHPFFEFERLLLQIRSRVDFLLVSFFCFLNHNMLSPLCLLLDLFFVKLTQLVASQFLKVFKLDIDLMFSVWPFHASTLVSQLDKIRVLFRLLERYQRSPFYERVIGSYRLECPIYGLGNLLGVLFLHFR